LWAVHLVDLIWSSSPQPAPHAPADFVGAERTAARPRKACAINRSGGPICPTRTVERKKVQERNENWGGMGFAEVTRRAGEQASGARETPMYGSLDISVSGMVAQRTRLETIAANLANRDAAFDAAGNPNPFRRRIALLAPGDPAAKTRSGRALGAHVKQIVNDMGEFRKVYDPTHPAAKPEGHPDAGYVELPNIDPVTEQVNSMEAQRAYEANLAAAEATKAMVAQALRILA
jgi:flagellar basal-body rod protein FlgC